jgi:hypothetical protein
MGDKFAVELDEPVAVVELGEGEPVSKRDSVIALIWVIAQDKPSPYRRDSIAAASRRAIATNCRSTRSTRRRIDLAGQRGTLFAYFLAVIA